MLSGEKVLEERRRGGEEERRRDLSKEGALLFLDSIKKSIAN